MDTLPSPIACGRFMHMDINTSFKHTYQGKESSSYTYKCWCTCTHKLGPQRLFHMKALRSSDFCPRIMSQKSPFGVLKWMKACFFISIPPFIFPGAWASICSRFWASFFGASFFCLCFVVIVYHFVLSPTKQADTQRFSPPASSSFLSFTRGMADDCALGDLLLDPPSVRCRD